MLNYGNFLQRGIDGNLYFIIHEGTDKVSVLKNIEDPDNIESIEDYLSLNTRVARSRL